MKTIKKIFVGSSNEAKNYLINLPSVFDKSSGFEIIKWNDNGVFSINNQSYLDSLLKQSYLVDFAIFLASADDITNSRGKEARSPRDNVIFEFGLFLQALGKERCFLMMEDNCRILSDMKGIELLKFKDKDEFCKKLEYLKTNLQEKKKHIPSLVTTGLAYGYYENFISKLAVHAEVEKLNIFLKKRNFDNNKFKSRNDLGVRQAFYEHSKPTHFSDYPTTLQVVDYIISDKGELSEHEKTNYKEREVNNFQVVLERLMEGENFKNKITFK